MKRILLLSLILFFLLVCVSCEMEPPHEHTFSTEWTYDNEYHWHEPTCGHDVVSGKAEHSWDSGVVSVVPTHTEVGQRTYTCVVCGKTKVETIEAVGHTWDEGEITKQASCVEEGEKTFNCSCGAVKVEAISALGHDYATEWTTDVSPTCTEPGSKSHHCLRCDSESDVTAIEATGHVYGSVVTVEPSCTSPGERLFTCSVCNGSYTETIDALGHDYSDEWTIDVSATCTEKGSKSHHCSRCDSTSEITEIPALGHRWNEGEITTSASCTAEGTKIYTCTVCGEKNAETIKALGHDYSEEWTIDTPATCTEDGSKSHHCSRCDSKSDVTVISATGHSWDNGEITSLPTCTEEGVRTYSCTVCDAAYTEKVAVVPHTWDAGKITAEPSCTKDGVRTFTCSVCKGTKTETVKALGHDYSSEWTIDTPVTCTENGSKSHHCSRCDSKSEVTVIPATGHSFSESWSMDETYHWHAATCGHSVVADKAEHSWVVDAVITSPTCTELGEQRVRCSCGATKNVAIPATGHSYSEEWTYSDVAHWHEAICGHDSVSEYEIHSFNDQNICMKCGYVNIAYLLLIDENGVVKVNPSYKNERILSLTIPAIIDEITVTEIADSAFSGCTSSFSVCLPNTVTKIGKMAFYGCQLYTFIIPDSVTTIDDGAFFESSFHGESVPESVVYIGQSAFAKSHVYKMVIPDSVTTLGSSAFWYCEDLTSIDLGSSIENIGIHTFDGCCRLLSIVIPDSVSSIGDYAFHGCYNMTSASIGNGVSTIADSAFSGCTKLATLTFGNSVETIGCYAFKDCSKIVSISLPASLRTIESGAFDGCTSLKYVTLQEGVERITFSGCTSIESITIPGSVETMGFSGCTGLSTVILSEGIESISTGAFRNCSSITSIRIPATVSSIGANAFEGCTNLSEIELLGSVTSIDSGAFSGCAFTRFSIPNTITALADSLFYNCAQLRRITIPVSVSAIGDNAFNGCSALNIINYEGTVEQWVSIEKGSNWNKGVPATMVHCSNGDVEPNHKHSYSNNWTVDNTYHWHASTCGHDTVADKAEHDLVYHSGKDATFEEPGWKEYYTCSTCGYSSYEGLIYLIGSLGPAGGYVFYDCDADNTTEDPDGPDDLRSDDCGWRYMETTTCLGPFPFGVIYDENDEGITAGTKQAIGSGKENTELLVEAINTYRVKDYYNQSEYTNNISRLAPIYISEYEFNGYTDWFIPSYDELYAIYEAYYNDPLNFGGGYKNFVVTTNRYIWSSTENSAYSMMSQVFFTSQMVSRSRHTNNEATFVFAVRRFL